MKKQNYKIERRRVERVTSWIGSCLKEAQFATMDGLIQRWFPESPDTRRALTNALQVQRFEAVARGWHSTDTPKNLSQQ